MSKTETVVVIGRPSTELEGIRSDGASNQTGGMKSPGFKVPSTPGYDEFDRGETFDYERSRHADLRDVGVVRQRTGGWTVHETGQCECVGLVELRMLERAVLK